MAQYEKPIFTAAEIAELESPRLSVGYSNGSLIPGYDFKRKPFKSKVSAAFADAKEKLDGTAKKKYCHAQINSFGWARFDKDKLVFGVKFSSPQGLTKIGEKAIAKYEQMLGYFLEQAGWKGIRIHRDKYLFGTDYIVPLDNPENIKLLYTLSPSIGFYYKGELPEVSDIERLEMMCAANLSATHKKQSKTR